MTEAPGLVRSKAVLRWPTKNPGSTGGTGSVLRRLEVDRWSSRLLRQSNGGGITRLNV
jgi:hypothetical protein